MPESTNPSVLVGMETRDDAGVFLLNEEVAMIQTTDFFTPIVDDPYDYGQIAAANSLSDIYAMGGVPKTALNILGFPADLVDKAAVAQIILGGYDKSQEAGVVILGGHSVKDPELKFGMAVTGMVHPSRIIRNNTGQAGDVLVLTKPIGTGILTTALKNEKLSGDLLQLVTAVMKELNKTASEIMQEFNVSACTDVTGFGLLGHLAEMAGGSGLTARVFCNETPLLPEALKLAEAGNMAGGLKENRKFLAAREHIHSGINDTLVNVLHDPQTSGGLLMAVPRDRADALVRKLHSAGVDAATIIGEFVPANEAQIELV